MNVCDFWKDVLAQDAKAIRQYFHEDAYVNWHYTNEHLTVSDFIRANCEYPGEWEDEVERIEIVKDGMIPVTHVYPKDHSASFHAASFIQLKNDKIIAIDEYRADEGEAPNWRLEKHIGKAIR